MIIGFFGISGVGKTTFTKRLKKECPNILRFSASELIQELDGKINYKDLLGDVVIDNQSKLAFSIKNLSSSRINNNIVLELHNIIETKEGPHHISKDILQGLGLDKVFFIKKDPNIIIENKSKDIKERSRLNLLELDKLQNLALKYFIEVYKDFDKEIISGSDEDVTKISKLLC
ncbi:hypothetical protein BIY29_18770 [Brenneria alni]|uniref:Adenylate kinase n=1 Tax=Brenneria alni TaxID=71656 RepID=A0A421DJ08_9GAMM|nr:AAA family ATPase [Brenneria alni]RLM18008.1 hypothetical protein BIY29_18770 [Brenneria alni]